MRPTRMYQCPACEQVYEFESDAEECCPNNAVSVYICGECEKIHHTIQAAKDCCKEEEDDAM